jgi:hypothetical protein
MQLQYYLSPLVSSTGPLAHIRLLGDTKEVIEETMLKYKIIIQLCTIGLRNVIFTPLPYMKDQNHSI